MSGSKDLNGIYKCREQIHGIDFFFNPSHTWSSKTWVPVSVKKKNGGQFNICIAIMICHVFYHLHLNYMLCKTSSSGKSRLQARGGQRKPNKRTVSRRMFIDKRMNLLNNSPIRHCSTHLHYTYALHYTHTHVKYEWIYVCVCITKSEWVYTNLYVFRQWRKRYARS